MTPTRGPIRTASIRIAEDSGFDFSVISDHFNPWLDEQGHTSHEFALLATDHDVRLSVGRTGSCWDNALAESWFSSLKTECIDRRAWPTRAAARAAVVTYISWFNSTRSTTPWAT